LQSAWQIIDGDHHACGARISRIEQSFETRISCQGNELEIDQTFLNERQSGEDGSCLFGTVALQDKCGSMAVGAEVQLADLT
jgi:hypothetical protein